MNGHIWKDYLNNSEKDNIIKYVNKDDSHLLICHCLEYRKFSIFESHQYFTKYVRDKNINDTDMCFFECIMDYHPRKPYFDIDITEDIDNADEIIIELKKQIKKLLSEKYSYMILVYTSHTDRKKSYHVIINGVYFSKVDDMIVFYDTIIKDIDPKFKKYFDKSVYSKTQLFRLLHSSKFGKQNKKIFCDYLSENYVIPESYIKNKIAEFNYNLGISLITNTNGCDMITEFSEKKKKNTFVYDNTFDININKINNILENKFPHFEIDKVLEGIITLRANGSYNCLICKRIHDNENPYLTVNYITKNISLVCRRQQDSCKIIKPLVIGTLKEEIVLKKTKDKIVYSPVKYQESLLGSELENLRHLQFN